MARDQGSDNTILGRRSGIEGALGVEVGVGVLPRVDLSGWMSTWS